jgi:pimeloyl-ACP methyl ester carboxylesterase
MKRILKIILIILGVLLVVLLIGPLLVPIPPLEGVVSPEKLADPDSQFIDVKGLKVHYKKFGQGALNFILLHGFAASEYSWREIYKPLSQYGTVMAYDRPGFGLTSRPLPGSWTNQNPYGSDFQVELVIAMMDAMKMDEAILVGNSAGGGVAAMTALKYPQRVQALVLVDAAVSPNTSSSSNNFNLMNALSGTPQLQRIGPLLVRNVRDWGIEFGKSAWHDPSKITPEIWAGYTKPLNAQDWDVGLWQYQTAPRAASYANRIKEFTMPVLVIAGDDDHIIPTKNSVDLAQVLPNAKLVVIPNSGHVPHEETPSEFMQALRDWLGKFPQ